MAAVNAATSTAAPAAPASTTTAASTATAPPQRQATTDANGAPLKVCGQCGEGIKSAFVMAKGQAFHPNHFQCSTCGKELGGKAYLEKDDKFYCEQDYYKAFNPKCGKCHVTIEGPYVTALDQAWHPEHFTCTYCDQPFAGQQFRKHEDKPYCDAHFEQLFAPKCTACGLSIKGQVYEAMDKKYHADCFQCAGAGPDAPHKIGEGVPFHPHEGKIYCPQHFEDLFLQKCDTCKQPIKAQYITVMERTMHPECWKCSNCSKALAADNCAWDSNAFWCRQCLSERRKTNAPAQPQQVQQQMGANPQAVPQSAAAPAAATYAAPAQSAASASADEKGAQALAAIQARQQAAKAAAAAPAPAAGGSSSSSSQYADPTSTRYPLSVLQSLATKPADVDPTRREQYLSDDEFQTAFKMDRDAFAKLADWKKKALKTPLGLF